jgi:predicted ATP-dependent serine protease
MNYVEAMKVDKELKRIKKIKCKHDHAYYVQECEGDNSYHIFKCPECNEYIIVQEYSGYDWDNASIVPKFHYENYNLENEMARAKALGDEYWEMVNSESKE